MVQKLDLVSSKFSATTKPRIIRVLNELIQVKESTGEGFYTAAMIVALNKLSEKELDDIQTLMGGLHVEVGRINSINKMAMLGPIVQQTFTSMAYLATTSPSEVIKLQSQFGVRILQNRRDEISPDWNAIMDVADTIYGEQELHYIASFLKDLQDYPNIKKDAIDIAGDALELFIFAPYTKIEGTAKDKLIRLELKNAVEKRIGARRQVGGEIEVETSTNKYTKGIVKFDDRTQEQTSSTIFMEYARNATIMKRLRHRMRLYKEKFRIIKKKERGSSKRGPTTTTTTTTTTTPKPPMRKSKYYIRKYVKKDLYKMTTTTKTTTAFRIRYYGKIRKFNIDADNFDPNQPKTDSDESEGYYSDTEYNNDEQADISVESVLSKPNDQFKTDELIPLNHDTNKKIAKTVRTTDLTVSKPVNTNKHLKVINRHTDLDRSIDEEDYLKANIRDAMMHYVNLKTNQTRKFVKDLKDDNKSVSDYEVEIKRNIYRAMNNPVKK
ncbi:uncharacterized protein LOC124542136 [Vanessa cardui]|uniref:uncharacterized protein LOC124542136 n=1 Tax=Vanessa cardui TaxID=171605 RepID=UPI001F1410EF|nr:uncharacterized protein LOC124542136 [Vanessa cardui]